MVLATFERLSAEKQERVRAALLTEFSHYPLAKAQVARIVETAGIARGAFYKYFTDLPDAYAYLFGHAMKAIHADLPRGTDTETMVVATRQFLASVQSSPYRALIEMHFRYNEGTVGHHATRVGPDPQRWAAAVLCHQTLKDVLLAPDTAEVRLQQLEQALKR